MRGIAASKRSRYDGGQGMPFLIYGANGYTGELIGRAAIGRGHRPILAGRTSAAVERLASELGLPHRVFGLEEPRAIDAGLEGARAVLNCAGPFAHTAGPMVEAAPADLLSRYYW